MSRFMQAPAFQASQRFMGQEALPQPAPEDIDLGESATVQEWAARASQYARTAGQHGVQCLHLLRDLENVYGLDKTAQIRAAIQAAGLTVINESPKVTEFCPPFLGSTPAAFPYMSTPTLVGLGAAVFGIGLFAGLMTPAKSRRRR